MEFKEIKEIINVFSTADIDVLRLEVEGVHLQLEKRKAKRVIQERVEAPVMLSADSADSAGVETPAPVSSSDLVYITSPIVGTFYSAPNPKAEPFVKIGDDVSVGQTLCIVEAMKLMNEIQSEVAGQVVVCYVENAQPVEYGQKLFGIKPLR